ncbi:MAG: hypothetical protein JXB49_37120 [Bacteroidales bacterium]|nr:hypothetical protein [Bacteroidales bacterium]
MNNDKIIEWVEPLFSNFLKLKIENRKIKFRNRDLILMLFITSAIFIYSITIIKNKDIAAYICYIFLSISVGFIGTILLKVLNSFNVPSVIFYKDFIRHLKLNAFTHDYTFSEIKCYQVYEEILLNRKYIYIKLFLKSDQTVIFTLSKTVNLKEIKMYFKEFGVMENNMTEIKF